VTGIDPVDQAAGRPGCAARTNASFSGWMPYAACQEEDPELFSPIAATGAAGRHQISTAKQVCQRCTVRASCLTYALETRQSGIWAEPPSKNAPPWGDHPPVATASKPAAGAAPAYRTSWRTPVTN
jgi:WhiB family transcriptional regulator, redox-sensing transcriptional regulator